MCGKACAYSIYTTHFMCILQRLIKIKQLKHCYYEAYVPREAETATPSISMPVSVNSWKLDNVYRDIVRGDEESGRGQSKRIKDKQGASE